MPGELPFFIIGKVVEINLVGELILVKVPNGNVYNLTPYTPGIDFYKLEKGQLVDLEITTMLTRVLSARIIDK